MKDIFKDIIPIGQDYTEIEETLSFLDAGNEQWAKDRVGKFTSSRLGHLAKKGRAKDKYFGEAAMSYIYEKVAELVTGIPHFSGSSRSTDWGNEYEGEAIEYYNSKTNGDKIEAMGKTFVQFNDNAGGSPDGYIGENGVAEIKCPYNSSNHLKTILEDYIKPEYIYQCQGNMLFSGRDWCDFVSYDPRMPEGFKLKVIRLERDEEICQEILTRIEKGVEKMTEILDTLGYQKA